MSKDLTNTVNDQLIEQNPVEALEQLKVFATDQSLIQEWDSEKANALYQEYLSNLDQYDGKSVTASKAYFNDYLNGKIIKTKIGPVRINSKSRGKIHDRMRDIKFLAIPYIPEVLMTGDVGDLVSLNKDRTDSVVGYYEFKKAVSLEKFTLNITVKVALDSEGNLLYYLGASKEKNQFTPNSQVVNSLGLETGFDSIESYDEDEINIDVQVLDKDGNILTEEQAEKLLLGDRHLNTSNLVKGRTNNVKTAKGTKVSTVFAVMEADKVIASHTATGAKNPEYPQELQPRDRGRDSSQAWVQKTSNDLDPESLGRSGRADTGAPIVGDDLVVESGNGRTMAIKLAYERGNADEYREWLIDEADYFGFKSEQIEQFKQPILVRIRTSDVDRVQFTIESNQDDKLSYSATERAKSDAKRLDDSMLALFSPGDDGDLLSTNNQKFVQAFLKTLGDTEAAQYITTNGKPTQALVARMKAAVFSKAYNDDRLLEMMADQTKPDLQNMLNALGVAAPKFIEAQAVSRGNVQDISSQIVDGIEQALDKQVANAIIDATNVILSAKQNNQDIVEFVKQQGLFSDLPEGVAEIAVFLSKHSRSAKKMSIFFKAMAEFSEKQAIDQQTMDLFGDFEPVSIKDAITYAEMILEQHYGDHQITMFDDASGFHFIALPTDDQVNSDPLSSLFMLLNIAKNNLAKKPNQSDELKPSQQKLSNFYHFSEKTTRTKRQKDNDAAVNLLRQFESGDRPLSSLTDADRDVLAKYTGSGGNLVTADGKKGSAYEYYTPKPIAQGMWDLMAELGFSGGKVLDPCAGMGIFGATSPDNAVVDAVELDSISGSLSKLINQNPTHNVTVSNFEKVAANTPDNSYDAVITNVPFGNNAARGGNQFDDARYQNESLETYFILRTLEKLKPNGLAMFITPPRCVSGRDPKEENLRIRASLLAEFLGAYRLPNKVFGAANADTITDVIVFKKHGSDALDKIDELSSTDMNALIDANVLWQEFIKGEYFKGEGLKYILGDFQAKDDTKYRDVDRVINNDSVANISKLLKKFKGSRINWNVLDAQESDSITYNEGDVIYQNGQPLSFVDGTWQPIELDNELLAQYKATESIVSKISDPYTAYFSKVTYAQANQARQDYLNRGRIMEMPIWANNLIAELDGYLSPDKANQHWDAIVVGLSVTFLLREYSDDLEMNYLESFARLSADLKNYRRFKVAASLSQSFKNAVKSINIHFNGKEYSAVWRGERQSLQNLQTDLDVNKQIQKTQYLNGTLYLDIADVKAIYQTENPSFDPIQDPDWVVMADAKRLIKLDDLCVGNLKNVLDKLDIELSTATDENIKTNLLMAKQLAYSKVHQTNISKLSFKLNSPLVKLSEKLEFAKQFIDQSAHIATNSRDGKQFIDINIKGSNKTFEDTLTNRVGDYFKNGTITLGGIDLPRGITAEMALERLRAKINDANTKFSVWVKSNPAIQERLTAASSNPENLYFKIANDDSPLVVENISPEWTTHGFQNAEIRRQARQFGGINGFNVGLGKTVTALVSVQHAHNIGVKNKTLFVVPGAVLSNWRKEAITGKGTKGNSDYVAPVYQSGDDCLFVGLSVDSKGNASVKSEDYDRDLNVIVENKHKKIFMTYEAFQRIAMRETTVEKYVNHLRLVDTAFAELERTADDEKTQSKIAFIGQELVKNKSLISPFFEEMGFDSIVIDEGHAFKNSKEAFDFESAKFLSLPEASSRALDAQAKCWFIRGGSSKNDGVLLLTATPITNSPLEIYSMLSLTVGEDQINKQMLDIRGADDFLKAVCIVENETETSVDGISKDYAMFTGLDNLEVLRNTIGSIANIQDAESVGAVFHLPDSPELSDPILLDKETMEKLKLYQEAYRIANLLKREKPVFEKDMQILAMVAQETGDNFELLAEPFNLINKMNNLSLDSELNKRVTFVFVANQKDAIEQAVLDFNKLNIQVKNLAKIGRYTPESAIVKSYQTKDNVSGKVFTRYDIKVTVSYDADQQMLILDSIDFGVQQKLEAILDKHKIDFDYATTPKYSALINNIKNELSNPRGLKRDGSLSRIVKQIVFSDVLATHNKIRRLISKKAGIPLQRITFVSGQYNNEPEKLLEVQAGFNGFDDENIYNVVIGNKKAEVGLNLQQGTQAIHHLTIGWTPDALTQRNGRGVRQGNMTAKVNIYYYDAEGTFDAYKRRLVNKKDEWITNLLQGDSQRVAIEGGLKKEQYEALINAQGSNISLDDMQLQLEQQERKARASRTINTQLAHIQTITTAKQNINRFNTFAQWVNKTVDDLGEVNKQIAKITKDMEKIKGGSDRDIKKRDRLNTQKHDLETSQSLIADQIRTAIVEKIDDIAWNEIVKKVGIAKSHKLSSLDQKKVIDDEIPLKVEWTEYLAQNQRVLKSANEELIKLSEDANVLKQNEIDQILEHGYQMLQGQVVTTGTVVKFTKDMPHNAKYGYFYDSENIRVFEVIGGVVKLYTLNLKYSDIGSSIEIVNKIDAEYQTALAYFAEFDDLAIIAEKGKLKEAQANFLALNVLPEVKKYLEQSFEIFYTFSSYRYNFNLPNFPLYLESLPQGTGNWSKFYDMQRNIVDVTLFDSRVAESKIDQLSTEKCDFNFVLDFLAQHHLKFKDYDELYNFVSQTMLKQYGFTEVIFKNFDPDQALLAIENTQSKTDLDVVVKDILDKTFAQYLDECPNLYKISSASTYKFISSIDLTQSFWNIERQLKAKIAEFSTESDGAPELNVLDRNEYVYLTGDSYRAKEFIDFRETAKKVDSDIAWYGKKIRGNDGAILKKAPKAPKNTWVMQRKLADFILKEYQEVVKKYDLEFKEAA